MDKSSGILFNLFVGCFYRVSSSLEQSNLRFTKCLKDKPDQKYPVHFSKDLSCLQFCPKSAFLVVLNFLFCLSPSRVATNSVSVSVKELGTETNNGKCTRQKKTHIHEFTFSIKPFSVFMPNLSYLSCPAV